MTTYTPQAVSNLHAIPAVYGIKATYNAANVAGDKVAVGSSERDVVHVKNATGGSSLTVTVASQVPGIYQEGAGSLVVPSMTLTLAAGEDGFIGPFTSSYLNADGTVSLAWSEVTGITFAALRLNPVSTSFN